MSDLAKFEDKHKRAAEMLLDVKNRLPWHRNITDSLIRQAERKGNLSDKQLSLITKLYLESCVRSDGDIKSQVECRKMCIRLSKLELGRTSDFIESVLEQTSTRPFSPLQMKSVRKIAKFSKQIESVPELDDNTFDGWYQTGFLSRALTNL